MPLTVGAIAEALGAGAAGDLTLEIRSVAQPDQAVADDLALAMEPAYAETLAKGQARAAVVWPDADWQALGLSAAIFAPRSRYVLSGVTQIFAKPVNIASGIHPSAVIEDGAEVGDNPAIGPFVHVQAGARVGANARIASHVSIGAGARIGDDALLMAHVTIMHDVQIGDRFICHAGTVIGSDGFSFVSPAPGALDQAKAEGRITEAVEIEAHARINSLGAVVLGDDVEIGANSCIDRGTIADTTIGDGTKIDNQVQIGHNVRIGRNCLLCGQCGVAGSTVIGDRVVVGGRAAIADHLRVASDVVITGASGVSAHVPPKRVMMGTPAIPMAQAVESYKALRRLPRILARLEAAQKPVSKDDPTG